MTYKVISTDEMGLLLDNCIQYLMIKIKNEQAAKRLLLGVEEVYDQLESNPDIYRVSQDPFMKSRGYHEAKVRGMDYMIIYKIVDCNVYVLGIFHTLENYSEHMKIIWDACSL